MHKKFQEKVPEFVNFVEQIRLKRQKEEDTSCWMSNRQPRYMFVGRRERRVFFKMLYKNSFHSIDHSLFQLTSVKTK